MPINHKLSHYYDRFGVFFFFQSQNEVNNQSSMLAILWTEYKKSIWHGNWSQSVNCCFFLSASKLRCLYKHNYISTRSGSTELRVYIIHHILYTRAIKLVVAPFVWRSLKGDCVNSWTVIIHWRLLCFYSWPTPMSNRFVIALFGSVTFDWTNRRRIEDDAGSVFWSNFAPLDSIHFHQAFRHLCNPSWIPEYNQAWNRSKEMYETDQG